MDVEERNSSLWYESLLDLSRVAIFACSLSLISIGSKRAIQLDKDEQDGSALDRAQTLSWKHVICFPIVGSMSLIIFFFYFEFLQYVFSLSTAVISAVAIYDLVHPYVHMSQSVKVCLPRAEFMSVAIAVLASTVWMLTGHWMILDVLGSALSVLMMKYVRVPSLKHSTVLLVALLVYDVFWVFYSSTIFQANVMLEVATKTMDNPVAAVAKSLDMPDIAQSRPSLSIPGKLVFPSSIHDDHYAMLGLGDIILPGFLLCFARRFDQLMPPPSQLKWTLCTAYHKLSYFQLCLLGYGIGLSMASLASEYYQTAQPALLYLVPCTLLPLIVKALLQGDAQSMWRGPFCEEDVGPCHHLKTTSSSSLSQFPRSRERSPTPTCMSHSKSNAGTTLDDLPV